MTFFWTRRVKLPKCKNCKLWKVLKQQWLLAVLKVKSLFLRPCVRSFITDMSVMAICPWKEWGKVSDLQARKKLYQGEEQQRTFNCSYILNTPPFCCCDKSLWFQQAFWSFLTLGHYYCKIINELSQIQKMGLVGLSKCSFSPSQHEAQSP